jgi:predicted O-methyltransferase YrrM
MKTFLLARYKNAIQRRLLPTRLIRALEIGRERRALASLAPLSCPTSVLAKCDNGTIANWLGSDLAADWLEVGLKMSAIRFVGGSGAVNPGDRRALYYLARALRPTSILEVGTHVGASTSMLAIALKQSHSANPDVMPRLVTVDIVEVNDPVRGSWKHIGCSQSPADVMSAIECQEMVTFVTSPSIPYLRASTQRFDLIFLDGDHAATAVYQELPAALRLLNPGGIILLHDFFPNLEPLWSDGAVVPGPQLAMARLHAENPAMAVKPFGGLPWPTKLGSNISSLAFVCRTE